MHSFYRCSPRAVHGLENYDVQLSYDMEAVTAASTTYSYLGLEILHTLIIHQQLTVTYVATP